MASSLSNLVDNSAKGIHKNKFKYRHDNKNVKNPKLRTKIVSGILSIRMPKMFYEHLVVYTVTRISTRKSLRKT